MYGLRFDKLSANGEIEHTSPKIPAPVAILMANDALYSVASTGRG